MIDVEAVATFEALVRSQVPASVPWTPVTDYSLDARRAVEGIHPQLIKDVFQSPRVGDLGCGAAAVLVRLLRELGVSAWGADRCFFGTRPRYRRDFDAWVFYADISDPDIGLCSQSYDLVICREVLEHLTIEQIGRAVSTLVRLSSKYIYVTTRFHPSPQHLLDVATSDDLDPTHITMLNKEFLRTLFVIEGCKSRYDLEERMDWKKLGRCLVFEVA